MVSQKYNSLTQNRSNPKGSLSGGINHRPIVLQLLALLAVSTAVVLGWTLNAFEGLAFLFTFFVLSRLAASQDRVAFLELVAINFIVALFWAAFVLHLNPSPTAMNESIAEADFPSYLAYAVPSCVALYLGAIAITGRLKLRSFSESRRSKTSPSWSNYLRSFIFIGICFYLITIRFVLPPEIDFFAELIADLRWVGLFGLILKGDEKWWGYGALLFGLELQLAINTTMFHPVILWAEGMFTILAYRHGWRLKSVFLIFGAILFVFILQTVKPAFRAAAKPHGSSHTGAFFAMFFAAVESPGNLINPEHMDPSLVRFNQGWIVNRVLKFVPAEKPFADGKTIEDDIVAILVPRFLMPSKIEAGGKHLFNVYTGQTLVRNTSMYVSTPAEMYLNFGFVGGIICMLIYGLILGLLYRWLALKARENPIWWAWGPFIGLWILKAEADVMNALNWAVKGLLVMGFILWMANRHPEVRERRDWPHRLPAGRT